MKQELRLPGYGGQNCDAVIVQRDDDSFFVYFTFKAGSGSPSLEEEQLSELISKIQALRGNQ